MPFEGVHCNDNYPDNLQKKEACKIDGQELFNRQKAIASAEKKNYEKKGEGEMRDYELAGALDEAENEQSVLDLMLKMEEEVILLMNLEIPTVSDKKNINIINMGLDLLSNYQTNLVASDMDLQSILRIEQDLKLLMTIPNPTEGEKESIRLINLLLNELSRKKVDELVFN